MESINMKKYIISVKDDKQIPIPKEVREKLELQKGDLILIRIEKVYGELPKGSSILVF